MRKHFYDDKQFDYRDYWRNRKYEDWCEKKVLKEFFSLVNQQLPLQEAQLCEIGSGFGRLAWVYLPLVKRAFLLEPAAKLRRLAKKELKEFSNFSFIAEPVETAVLKKETFDIVLMVRVLHHLSSPSLVFKKVFSSLKPGGYFILEFPNKLHLKNWHRLFKDPKIFLSLTREDRRSPKNRNAQSIPFFNYHPRWVTKELKKTGFLIEKKVSVSNCRSPFLKKLLPLFWLKFLERLLRPLFSLLNWGPSIFVLCKKPDY